MGMTITEKIMAYHAGVESVKADELIMAKLDIVLGNDITSPVAINEFEKAGFDRVFDKDKIALVMDHFVPCKDIKSAMQVKQVREFSKKYSIKHYYDVGKMGIEHALLPELGIVKAGDMIIGADSHTCTYGALGAFATGVGSTDMAVAMSTGESWFKVPKTIKFNLTGQLKPFITGKDVILHIIGMIGVDGARYCAMEFAGEGVHSMSMDDRFTIANMVIEAGAKNGVFPVDDKTRDYMKGRVNVPYKEYTADSDASYLAEYDIDLSRIDYTVAFPHLPENVKTPSEWGCVKVDQIVIGSCTNGRYSDLKNASMVLKGHKLADGVRCIIIPATQDVYKKCMNDGIFDIFIDAGAVISTPTCGPCLGGYMGILADGEKCIATTNRNFIGRMGHTKSEIYLASPAVAAASAILGRLATPEEVL